MNEANQPPSPQPGEAFLEHLIHLFYPRSLSLGSFEHVSSSEIRAPYAELLSHNRHMTVTVEAFHGDAVDVEVLRTLQRDSTYCREILLKTQQQKTIVQHGIVRLHLHLIAESPRQEILAEQKPLGRVLIEHDVLREVELLELWRVGCGPVLSKAFGVPESSVTFGRTAIIHCDGEPAIELLEIVAPAQASNDR
jgi:chorismate-pyruvate lyase